MDVYSFAFIMWEVFFEHVPFDNDLTECTRYVLEQEGRPKIIVARDDTEEVEEEITCTQPIASLIRKCWSTNPVDRPNFNYIIDELTKEIGF